MKLRAGLLALLHASQVFAQTPSVPPRAAAPLIRDLVSPSTGDAAFPQLASDGRGGVYMTWLETLGEGRGHRLRISHRANHGEFEAGVTVHEGLDFWPNWADFPGLGVFPDGAVMAHWLARSGDSTYDYDIRAAISRDQGRTWGPSFLVNTDGVKAEHGFVSYAPTKDGLGVLWLDGRATKASSGGHEEHASGPGAMTLRFAEFGSDGKRLRESLVDARVCDCCQTAVVSTPRGLLAAYRDRSDDEIRDISLVRPESSQAAARPLAVDGWKIKACPVNGPALHARGDRVAAAWFTMAGDKPRVRFAVSSDAGESFSAPVDLDASAPLGRIDAALLPKGDALVAWVVRVGEGQAEIRAARVKPGEAPRVFPVAPTSVARASGFPRLEAGDDGVVFAWTEVGKPAVEGGRAASRVRVALLAWAPEVR